MPEIPAVDVATLPDPIPGDLHVLDVREDLEWTNGHIEGAQHIPLQQVPGRVDELPDGRTLVVCKMGGRSSRAVTWLAEQGFDVLNLDGGMLEWAQARRPMVSETGRPPRVV